LGDPVIVGLAGVIAGVIATVASLWWNYATRASQHREFLYERQIKMYPKLTDSLRKAIWPLINSQNAQEFKDKIEKAESDLLEPFYMTVPILPQDVGEAILRLEKTLEKTAKLDDLAKMRKNIIDAELDVYAAIRKSAGTDPLSDEMRQIFGERV
jgi:hypothetical protein